MQNYSAANFVIFLAISRLPTNRRNLRILLISLSTVFIFHFKMSRNCREKNFIYCIAALRLYFRAHARGTSQPLFVHSSCIQFCKHSLWGNRCLLFQPSQPVASVARFCFQSGPINSYDRVNWDGEPIAMERLYVYVRCTALRIWNAYCLHIFWVFITKSEMIVTFDIVRTFVYHVTMVSIASSQILLIDCAYAAIF